MFTKKNVILSLVMISVIYILYKTFIKVEPFSASDFTFNEVVSVPAGLPLLKLGRDNSVQVITSKDYVNYVELPARVVVKEWNYYSARGRPYKIGPLGHNNKKTILAIKSNGLDNERKRTLVFTRA